MFERILFRTIIEQAIAAEEKAYRFYNELAEKPEYSAASEILKTLAGQELLHRTKLEELQREGSYQNLLTGFTAAEEPFQCPYPNGPEEAARDVLTQAIEREREAASFYTRIGDSLKGKKAEPLFRLLAGEEKRHIESLSACIDETA